MEGDIGDGDCEYASYSGVHLCDEESLYGDERFTMECSSNRFLNGCSHVHCTNVHLYEGGTQHEKHHNTRAINYNCANASVLENKINII